MTGTNDSNDLTALLASGAAHNQAGEFDEAVADFKRALALASDVSSGPGLEQSEAAFGLAAALRALEDYEEAEPVYEHAFSLDPDPAEPYWELGYTREMLGNRVGAAWAYRECLAREADHGVARHLLDALTGATTASAPDDYVTALFDDYAKDFDRSMAEDLQYTVPDALARKLGEICARPENTAGATFTRTLDLGAGTGLTGTAIRKFAADIHAVDLSPEMLALATARGIYSKTFAAGMAAFLAAPEKEFPGAHQSYDLLISGDALVYIGDLAPLFRSAGQRLIPGGWFLFTVEAAENEDFVLQNTGRYAHGARYLRTIAAEAGFHPGTLDAITPRRDGGTDIKGLLGAFPIT
ncbi:MAG: tetratricopeptide repeat protein [Pseudomonadota bacterium]|nr:tetratricopeptide repeat protein [Pseudomonadota bacterium]